MAKQFIVPVPSEEDLIYLSTGQILPAPEWIRALYKTIETFGDDCLDFFNMCAHFYPIGEEEEVPDLNHYCKEPDPILGIWVLSIYIEDGKKNPEGQTVDFYLGDFMKNEGASARTKFIKIMEIMAINWQWSRLGVMPGWLVRYLEVPRP